MASRTQSTSVPATKASAKTSAPVAKKASTPEGISNASKNASKAGQLVVVLVRGFVDMPEPIFRTLSMLRLTRKNFCAVVPNTAIYQGMITKVKDYVTWGEISPETFAELVRVRGQAFISRKTDAKELYSYKVLTVSGKEYKPYFRLNPPRKGFGRKGIKVAFVAGGALGYRGEKINDLIMRML
ncbi:50S ribosomal protein L30 [Candidatus Woesearchaeota archaeon]|nr:50S ribosomal protein L30 [Candidatus Woesearchaeota archaeon]